MTSLFNLGGNKDQMARVRYLSSDYEVLSPGTYVLCAVTGERIPLANLRYWNAVRQEAYRDGVIATQRHDELRRKAERE